MLAGEYLPHPVLQAAHSYALVRGYAQQVDLIAPVVNLLGYGQGDAHGLVGAAVDAHVSGAYVHSYHLVIHWPYLDEAAAGVSSGGEEAVVDALADYAYLAFLQHIGFIDVAAVLYAGLLNLAIVGVYAFDVGIYGI